MSKRAPKRKLAASFVVSVALLPACGGAGGQPEPGGCKPPECHMNPPPPPDPPPTPSTNPTAAPNGPSAP